MLFSALIAEHRFRQVLFPALRTEPRLGFFIGFMTAAGTKFRGGRQVFAAVGALAKHEQLMAAVGTKTR